MASAWRCVTGAAASRSATGTVAVALALDKAISIDCEGDDELHPRTMTDSNVMKTSFLMGSPP
jgi:hypothetical protein